MRLAVVSPGYPPALGGVEMLVKHTSASLAALGVEVEVWTHSGEDCCASAAYDGDVLVRTFPAMGTAQFPISPSLARYVRAHAGTFDILHVHNYHALAAASALLAGREVPVVLSPHFHGGGHSALARALHKPYRQVGRRLLGRADRIIAVSTAEQTLIESSFPSSSRKTVVVHNGADTNAIVAAEPWPDEPSTVLVLGRLAAYKHVDRTLAAFAEIDDPRAQLVVLGDGPERPALAATVRSRGIRARLLGRLQRPDVCRWLRTARVVVTVSEHEAFGIVALEAVAAGAIAVASDIPAHREVREIAPQDRITLVGLRDAGELASALAAAMSIPNQGALPVRSWTEVARDYESLYRNLTESSISDGQTPFDTRLDRAE